MEKEKRQRGTNVFGFSTKNSLNGQNEPNLIKVIADYINFINMVKNGF